MWLLHQLQHLIHAATPILQTYGLWALVIALFLENKGVIFAPGESILVASGFFAANGMFPIGAVLTLAILSAYVGGYSSYFLGDRFGHKALLRYGRHIWITPAMIEKTHTWLSRWGAPIFVLGRFVVPLRQLQGYVAGSAEVGFSRFALWSTIGAMLWVLVWGGVVWFLATKIAL